MNLVDNVLFKDFSKRIDKDTGFLHVNGVVSRTGLQAYYGIELGDTDNPTKTFNIYRPKEEVLSQESLDTFINSPICDNHPEEFVTVDNQKELIKGSLSSIETYNKDGIDYVKAKIVVQDKNLINKIMSGKVELSAGYQQDLIKEKGEFKGEQYDYKQTNIKINHVAFVDKGRCGNNCKITADKNSIIVNSKKNNKGKSMKVTIDGVEHEITDCVGRHIGSLNSKITSLDEDMEVKKKELEEKDMELEKEKGEKAKMKEDMEEEKKKTSDSTIDALVSEKVELMKTADTLKVEVKSTDSTLDMKKSIIAASSKIDLNDKTPEFIDGVYQTVVDGVISKQVAVKESQKTAFDGLDGKQQVITDAQVSANMHNRRKESFRKVGK